LRRLLDGESRMPIKEIPKHRRVEVDGEIGNGGVVHLDETARKTRRSAFDSKSRKSEKWHQSPATDGHGPKMRATEGATLRTQQKRTTISGNHCVEQSAEIGRAANCR